MGWKRGLLNQFFTSISKSSKRTLFMLKLKHIFVIFNKIEKKLLNRAIFVVYHPKYWGSVGSVKKVNPGNSLQLKCKKG